MEDLHLITWSRNSWQTAVLLMCARVRGRRMAGRWGVAEDVQVHSERDRKVHRQKTDRKWNETRGEKIKRKKGNHWAGVVKVGVAGLGINRGRLRSLWRSFDLCSSSSCLLFDMRVNEVIHGAQGYTGSAPIWALNLLLTSRAVSGVSWCSGACQTKKLKMAVYRETLCSFGNAALRRTWQIDLKGWNTFPQPTNVFPSPFKTYLPPRLFPFCHFGSARVLLWAFESVCVVAFMYSFIFHARNSTSLQLLLSVRVSSFCCLHVRWHTCVAAICVCVLKVLHLQVCFQKQDCDCSFVAHSCPTLGISRYSPGSKGFSEALLIGCNLLFKLESQQASSLAVYKQLMQGTPILLVTTGVYLFARPAVPSHLISGPTPRRIDSSCSAGPRCKQLLSSGAFWGRGATGGDLVWILKCPWGWWRDLGIGGVSFLGADEIIMHRVGEAEICTWKSSPFALLASNVPPMTIPASHSLYANEFSQLPPPQRVGQPSSRRGDRQRDIKWRRQSGAFLLCFVCVCLVYF